jgi:hypothetical protein
MGTERERENETVLQQQQYQGMAVAELVMIQTIIDRI